MESQKHTPVYLTANYHTHTARCGHAVGADEEYVKAAIAAGMQVLGFSDHIPWPDQVPPRDTLHMRMNRAAEYAASVCALREKYRDQIAIYLGFEAEYLPEFYEAQMKMCEELDVDYLIMGQHFLPESLIYAGSRTGSRRVLERYVDTVLEGLSTGAYSCLCHPDLVDFAGDGAFYRKQMRRLCEGVKKMGIPLEINLLGLTTDEAVAQLDKYLDDAYLSHLKSVRVVHGKGTGALRNAVHQYLRRQKKIVDEFHLAEFGEGDAGVTIVTFK